MMLKLQDWWKHLSKILKISNKGFAFFLDDQPAFVRRRIAEYYFPNSIMLVDFYSPYFCVTSIRRDGGVLREPCIRTSDIKPHFATFACIKGARIYGRVSRIGDNLLQESDEVYLGDI